MASTSAFQSFRRYSRRFSSGRSMALNGRTRGAEATKAIQYSFSLGKKSPSRRNGTMRGETGKRLSD
ncbi:hypothetical protein Y043_6100 [Burkholderia pseudomallei MSHR2138]|nr:hypothetical protein Y043_6100 [Burkholderia pseudomallei MSHR2138]